jgi:hypothetical protein
MGKENIGKSPGGFEVESMMCSNVLKIILLYVAKVPEILWVSVLVTDFMGIRSCNNSLTWFSSLCVLHIRRKRG